MGNSLASTNLPYVIEEETHPSTRQGSYGFSIHNGYRKSDNLPVTIFKAEKKKLASTPLSDSTPKVPTISFSYLLPSFHHIQKLRTILHPSILRAYATLDTDVPTNKINDTNINISFETMDEKKSTYDGFTPSSD